MFSSAADAESEEEDDKMDTLVFVDCDGPKDNWLPSRFDFLDVPGEISK